MRRRRRWIVRGLLALGGGAALVTAALARGRRDVMSSAVEQSISAASLAEASTAKRPPPAASLAEAKPEIVTYVVGYAIALALTLAAFALVHWRLAPPATALGLVFVLALAQIVVHFRCFLHVTLHGPARDDLQLILFSTLIVALMVGGTLVIIFNLRMRMM